MCGFIFWGTDNYLRLEGTHVKGWNFVSSPPEWWGVREVVVTTRKTTPMLHADMGHLGQDRKYHSVQIVSFGCVTRRTLWNRSASANNMYVPFEAPFTPHCAPLGSIVTSPPMELVTLDDLGLEECCRTFENVLVITDHFIKYAMAVPIKNQTTLTTACVFLGKFVVHYGLSVRLYSGQGRNFESRLLQRVMSNL